MKTQIMNWTLITAGLIKSIDQNWRGGEEILPQKPQLTLEKGDQEMFSTQIHSTGP